MAMTQVTPNKLRLIVKIRTLITNNLTSETLVQLQWSRKQIRGELEQNLHILWFCKCLLDHRSKKTISHWPGGHSYTSELQSLQTRAFGGCWCAWLTDGQIKIVLRVGTICKQQVGGSHSALSESCPCHTRWRQRGLWSSFILPIHLQIII